MINSRFTLWVNPRGSSKSTTSKPLNRYLKMLLVLLIPGVILLTGTLLLSQAQQPAQVVTILPSDNDQVAAIDIADQTTSLDEKVNLKEKESEPANPITGVPGTKRWAAETLQQFC